MSQKTKNEGGIGCGYAVGTILLMVLIAVGIRIVGAHYGVTQSSCYAKLPNAAVCMAMPQSN